jgi:glycine cleavage system H protein
LPVAGTITEINPVLENEPEKVNTDPYGDGWMVKMKMDNADDINNLMDVEAYKKLVS